MGLEDGAPDEIRIASQWKPTADGRPLGLAAFACTTYIMSAFNAGWAPDFIWIGAALFYGGLGQLLAGMWQFKRNCTFTATAFSTYGCFWMSLAAFKILEISKLLPKETMAELLDAVGWFLLAFFLFNTYVLAASLMMCVVEVVVFFLLELTLLCLFVGHLKGQPAGLTASWTMAGGYFGIFTAIAAWYYSFACLFNSLIKKQVIPVGPPLIKFNVE
ncbi:unnamed protein product [Closterium sp. Naga37s-1]|nr:unnamed protein product [Closterium sp. Naga37s-1]